MIEVLLRRSYNNPRHSTERMFLGVYGNLCVNIIVCLSRVSLAEEMEGILKLASLSFPDTAAPLARCFYVSLLTLKRN